MSSKLEISPKTIIFSLLIIFGAWLVFYIRDILALLFVSYIFMSALRPSIDRLEAMRLPRFLAISVMYMVIIAVIISFSTIVFPPLVSESIRLANNLPAYVSEIAPTFNLRPESLVDQIAPISQNIVRVTVGVFSNIITIFTLAVFTFYFLLEHSRLHKLLGDFIGIELGERIVKVSGQVEERLGAWVRGQLLLALIIGFTSYSGLTILGVNYALPLALIAGLLEMIPIIGPIIAGIPAVLIALTVSPGLALAVFALYFVIQQLENNLIVPTVMQKTVGIPPLASLLALMIGGRLGGTFGVILSIPVFLVTQTILSEIFGPLQKSSKPD